MRINPFSRPRPEAKASPRRSPGATLMLSPQATWPTRNAFEDISQGYLGNSIAYSCVNVLARSASDARLCASRPDGTEVEDGPLARLLAAPNPRQDAKELVTTLVTHLMAAGNAYMLKEREGPFVVRLRMLRPDRVKALTVDDRETGVRTVVGYEYEPEFGGWKQYPASDVGHIALENPLDEVFGRSPMAVVARELNIDFSASSFIKGFFDSGGTPKGIFRKKGKFSGQEEVDELDAAWNRRGEAGRSGTTLFLDDAADYQKIGSGLGSDEVDMQAVTDRTESRICAAFGVPPILVGALVGLQYGTYSNYEQARASFWDETMQPLLLRIAAFLNRCLAPEFPMDEPTFSLDTSEVPALAEDQDALSARVLAELAANVITPDEARERLGYGPRPEQAAEPAPQPGPARLALGAPDQAELLQDEAKAWADAARGFSDAILRRVAGVAGRPGARLSPSDLVPRSADRDLASRLRPHAEAAAAKSWRLANVPGDLGNSEPDPRAVAEAVEAHAAICSEVGDSVREAMGIAIGMAEERGYSRKQLVNGEPADRFPGLRALAHEAYAVRLPDRAASEVGALARAVLASRRQAVTA